MKSSTGSVRRKQITLLNLQEVKSPTFLIHADFELEVYKGQKIKVQPLFEPHIETGPLTVTSDIQANVTETCSFLQTFQRNSKTVS